MMELFASLIAGDLLVEARRSDGLLRLDWTGHGNARRPQTILAPCFEEVLQRARETGCGIEAHFERLESLNSSTVVAVVELIRAAREQGTSLSIVFDEHQKWQVVRFEALKTFEREDGLLKICSTATLQ